MDDRYEFLRRPPQSYWLTPSDQPAFPSLKEDVKADVAIVGGGMAGITLAWLLVQEGARPVLLEADRILFGTTGHTTAKLTSQHDLIYDRTIRMIGREQAAQYAAANEAAIREVERNVNRLGIDCDFLTQDAYAYTQLEKNVRKLEYEAVAAQELGIPASVVDRLPVEIPVRAALKFENQAQFHPRKYLLALVERMRGKCGLFERTRAVDLEEESGGYRITTGGGHAVRAERAVIATHYPFFNKHAAYFARLYVERSYLIAIRAKQKYPGGMCISVEDPVRSLRSQPSHMGELIFVGGENHKAGQHVDTLACYRSLSDFARQQFGVEDIPFHWSAQDVVTLDELPFAGQYSEDFPGLYVATGFRKWGMTNSTASAMVLRDLLVRGRSDWQDAYAPSRFHLAASAKNAVVENANVAANLLEGKLSALPDGVEVQRGEGQVIRIDGHRAGAYRDMDGSLHLVDTTCTHMGCEVNWNNAEKSWDCPCHGSRFDVDGNVIEGPAVRGLNSGKSVNTVEKLIKDEY